MKTVKIILVFVLLTPIIAFSFAGAQTEPTQAEIQRGIRERVQARKNQSQINLDEAQKARISARCKAAQTALNAVSKRVEQAGTIRSQVFNGVLERLKQLAFDLEVNNVDTSTLASQIVSLEQKVSGFDETFAANSQAVQDIAQMEDCGSDPEGFRVSLESARSLAKDAKQSESEMINYLKETIKPTLQAVRSELASMNNN